MSETKTQERLTSMSRAGAFGSSSPIRSAVKLDGPPANKKIIRTSAGLRDSLFDALEKVRDGEMVAEDAKAISGLAAQICNTVSLEIQVAKLRTEYPADTKLILPSALALGIEPPEKKAEN